MSTNNTLPDALTANGRTWSMLSGNYVLKTISSGTGGVVSNAGNTGSTTLTAAQSGIPAHSHGLNSHTHSIPALSGTATSAGAHSHKVERMAGQGCQDGGSYQNWYVDSRHNDATTTTDGAHTHSVTTTASTTGQASGSTANNTAANASQGHTHTAGMPQNIGVYVWKRTA